MTRQHNERSVRYHSHSGSSSSTGCLYWPHSRSHTHVAPARGQLRLSRPRCAQCESLKTPRAHATADNKQGRDSIDATSRSACASRWRGSTAFSHSRATSPRAACCFFLANCRARLAVSRRSAVPIQKAGPQTLIGAKFTPEKYYAMQPHRQWRARSRSRIPCTACLTRVDMSEVRRLQRRRRGQRTRQSAATRTLVRRTMCEPASGASWATASTSATARRVATTRGTASTTRAALATRA